MFKHHDQFRQKFREELGTYDDKEEYTEFENKVLGFWHETAFGSWKTLRDEIGLKERHKTLPFMKLADVNSLRESNYNYPDYDATVMNLMTSFFTPIDMTEYEDMFVGPGETSSFQPDRNMAFINSSDGKPREYAPNGENEVLIGEAAEPKWGVSNKKQEVKDVLPEEDDDDDEEDEDEDEDEEEEYTNGLDNEEDHEPLEWPPPRELGAPRSDSDFFGRHEGIRDRYSDPELDGFMKLLNVKPHAMWQNTALYHHSMGIKAYEDVAQMVDPEYHLHNDVERDHYEAVMFKRHRKGAEVRFNVGDKKVVFPQFKY